MSLAIAKSSSIKNKNNIDRIGDKDDDSLIKLKLEKVSNGNSTSELNSIFDSKDEEMKKSPIISIADFKKRITPS